MEHVIQIENICREFETPSGKKVAVDHVSFRVGSGTIFGLLGPNGAGKSTTIKMLTTILLPTSGVMKVLGHDIYTEEDKIRPHIGLLYGGEHGLYWQLSGRDNLRFFGSLFRVNKQLLEQRIDYWLERLGLKDAQHRLVSQYSKGMKQRLHIARVLLHDPTVIFMDEPTLGLDPQGTLELREIIKELKQKGKTIILTTHDMEEAQELCDEIAFIMDGKVVLQGTYKELQASFQEEYTYEIELMKDPCNRLSILQDFGFDTELQHLTEEDRYLLTVRVPRTADGEMKFVETTALLSEFYICQIVRKNMDLRSIYLQLVKNAKKIPVTVTA